MLLMMTQRREPCDRCKKVPPEGQKLKWARYQQKDPASNVPMPPINDGSTRPGLFVCPSCVRELKVAMATYMQTTQHGTNSASAPPQNAMVRHQSEMNDQYMQSRPLYNPAIQKQNAIAQRQGTPHFNSESFVQQHVNYVHCSAGSIPVLAMAGGSQGGDRGLGCKVCCPEYYIISYYLNKGIFHQELSYRGDNQVDHS